MVFITGHTWLAPASPISVSINHPMSNGVVTVLRAVITTMSEAANATLPSAR